MNIISANKRVHPEIDFGFVGDVEGVNAGALGTLLEDGITPVLCPITHDKKGQLLNTNADTIASALAVALSKKYEVQLNYCFEKKGVLKNVDDENSLIETMTKAEYKKLVEQGVVSKGMIPKLDNSFEAIEKGVGSVVIGHADDISKMINENEKAGTELLA
jgi:acetylglutamate kinase